LLIEARVHDSFRAMENRGLALYKQSLLLFDEKASGVEDKMRVAYGTSPIILEGMDR
jgi:aminopeptidase N